MENFKKILVTGASGQLGCCVRDISLNYPEYEFHFNNSQQLDITNEKTILELFSEFNFSHCINCAAYTAVDKAETDSDQAYLVNAESVRILAEACKLFGTTLIHISTDFIFDGTKDTPYNEEDLPHPINVYGASKLRGEQQIESILQTYFIIRTSWVYSEYGKNFVKTMLRLGEERDEISVVNDQVGSPTYAKDLAEFIFVLINDQSEKYGIYNYCNEGVVSWYDFAKAIFEISQVNISVSPIPSSNFPTAAKRPTYSVLDNGKIKQIFSRSPGYWLESLESCLRIINGPTHKNLI